VASADEAVTPEELISAPHPALRRLEPLVGSWELHGRSLDADEDNIFGTTTFAWLPGGHFLQASGEIRVGEMVIQSIEIIGYDPARDLFPSSVYSSMNGEVFPYEWDVRGETVVHRGFGATYTGRFGDGGRTLVGGWRPDEGTPSSSGSAYDAVMVRVSDDEPAGR
jgi:hypothetical protein